MTLYLLPCTCGETVPVATSQAGETVACACGRALAVPTMREVRRLQPAPNDQPAAPRPSWSALQGVLFVTGILLLLIGSAIAIILFYYGSLLDTEKPEIPSLEQFQAEVDKFDVVTSLDRWDEINKLGLAQYRPSIPMYLHNREVAGRYRILSFVSGGFAGFGLLLAVASLLLRKKRGQRRYS